MTKGKRNLVLLILSMIAGLVYLTPLLRFSFYDQMARALQLTDIQIGTIGGIYGISNVASYFPSGFLADKFSTKKLLIISNLGMALTTVWYSMFPGYNALIIIHVLYGIFSVGTFWSPYLKAVRSLGPDEEQGRLFGVSEGLRGVIQTVVAFACLAVMSRFVAIEAGFRAMLLINAAMFTALAVAVMMFVPDTTQANDGGADPNVAGAGQNSGASIVMDTLKSSSTWLCICVIFCGFNLWTTLNGYVGTYCTRVLHISEELSSSLAIVRSYVIVFFAGFSGGFIIDRFSTKGKGLVVAFLLILLCLVSVFATSKMVPLCLAMTIVLGYLINVIKATYWSIMGEAGVPPERTGMATGIISLIGLSPEIFASPIVGRLLHYGETNLGSIESGFNLMLAWCAVWAVLGIFFALVLKRKAEARN